MSLQKIHKSPGKTPVRSSKPKAKRVQKPQGELDLSFETQALVECPEDPHEIVREFLHDLRLMCQLIEEAGRYGTTITMEKRYRCLRSNLATGYKVVKEETGIDLFPAVGFHGSGFEMIFSSYSLDGLVRGPGMKTVERLADVWRAAQSARIPERRISNNRS